MYYSILLLHKIRCVERTQQHFTRLLQTIGQHLRNLYICIFWYRERASSYIRR